MTDQNPKLENLYKNAFKSEKVIKTYRTWIDLMPTENNLIKKYFNDKNSKILDIGCGAGRISYNLNKMGYDVIGIDISEPMIYLAKKLYPNLKFEIGDTCDLRFAANYFNYVIFSFNGLDAIYPKEKRISALKEINRVLKKGGIFLFSSHNSFAIISRKKYFYKWIFIFLYINLKHRRKISHYMYDYLRREKIKILHYFNSYLHVKKQLQQNGFKLIEVQGVEFKSFLKYFEPWPYFIAKKV
ncbi:MAG: class I SAM-dependent methyltransferase [Promethearchaeota archaeon]